jgi:hypothetical protein
MGGEAGNLQGVRHEKPLSVKMDNLGLNDLLSM